MVRSALLPVRSRHLPSWGDVSAGADKADDDPEREHEHHQGDRRRGSPHARILVDFRSASKAATRSDHRASNPITLDARRGSTRHSASRLLYGNGRS